MSSTTQSTSQSTNQNEDLAIIGVACRFPGHSNDLASFWANLNNGNDCVIDTPKDRWNADFFVDADKENPGKIKTTRCGFIDSVYEFDYEAFGINKKEAENMDPQQKILLELTMQTFEDARVQYQGSKTGVYVGIGQAEQLELTTSDLESINAYSVTGSALSIASNRISYVFDLRGPSLSVDTACSSAMTAMHMAVQAIRNGECDQAVVAGVNLLMSPSVMIQFSKLGVMSQDGKCKSFTDAADGYVRSEGCGVVLLKPLSQALRDHNHVYAVVKGTALNQDGHQTPSLTLPSGDAQGECFAAACVDARIDPKDVFFAELHATGTKVGDPVEANSVGKLFGTGRNGKPASDDVVPTEKDLLRVGGVKTHVGHLECASYMAGLLKCIAMIQHETLVPNLYSGEGWKLNPAIHFDEYNMRVQSKHEKFDPHQKLMMISSFGFGGANGCSIIQGYKPHANAVDSFANGNGHVEATETVAEEIPSGPYLYMLSAATPGALDARIKEVKTIDASAYSPYDISYTLATRPLHRNVSVGVGASIQEALFAPAKKAADEASPVVWVFAGQGPQHPEMGRHLYQRYPVFRAAIDEMDEVYKSVSGESLVHDVGVFGVKKGDPMAVYSLKYTLPSLVFLQTALCDLWRSFGVAPVAVFGHSFGEMAAAYAAGVCNKTQLVTTAYHRARLLARIDGNGVMMAVGCSHEQIQPWLDEQKDKVWIAAFNGPNSITVGGTKEGIEAVAAQCAKANLFHRVLKITNAYHTPLMNPCKEEALQTFAGTLAGTRAPQTPYFSTVTGEWRDSHFDAAYTWAGIEGPVLFTAAVKGCLERFGENTIFQEMSAHPVLSAYLTECGVKNSTVTLHRQQNEQETTLKALAYLKIQGCNIDFTALLKPHRPIPLFMSYPFQRQYCHKEDLNHRMMREVPSWRPLAGREIANVTQTFQTKVSLKSFPWTADHVVQGPCIFPGAGYIEMCMEVLNSTSIGDITIGRAMIVPNDGNAYRTVRTVADNDEKKSVKIFSKMDQWDNGPWTQHVAAAKAELTASPVMPSWTEGLKTRCKHGDFNQKAVYERFKSVGLQYGPLFQGVTQMLTGDNEAFGVMNVKAIHENNTKYHVHPALLDATFHVLLGTIRYMYLPFVPTHIRRVQWFVKASEMSETLHVYARASSGDNSMEGDIVITEESGRIVGFVEGMQCTALGQTANQRPFQPTVIPQWQAWGPTSAFAPTRSTVWDSVQAPAAGLDAGLSAYAAHFLGELKKSPKPLAVTSLPAQKQHLYSVIENLAAQSSNEKAIAELESMPVHEAAVVNKLGKGLTDLVVDANGFNKVFNDNTLTDLFSQSASFKPSVQIIVEQVVQLLNDSNRVVHILEVAHGSTALASELIPALAKFPGRVEYVYADAVNKTLSEAKTKFANQSFVDYKTLNIDNAWSTQGIDNHSFEIVLCNNSLHNAVDPVAAVRSVNQALVPNGIVLAVESTHVPAWLSLIYKSNKQFSELNAAQWEAAFQTVGFHSVNQQTANQSINTLFSAQSAPLSVNAAAPALPENVVVFDTHQAGNDMNALLALAQKDYEARPEKPLEFWVLTSGGEAIADSFNASTPEPEHATFIGFTRTWANEANQHRIRNVDFEIGTSAEDRQAWLRTLASLNQSVEREIAIRNNTVMVPRFLPYVLPVGDKLAMPITATEVVAPFRLEVDTIGQISSLRYHALPCSNGKILDHGEYEVVMEVKASALNFKDLMLALGMLDNPMGLDAKALKFHPPTAMGLEASGVIIAVGSKVTKFTVGDEVFGICDHSLASQAVTHEDFIAKKPAHLTHVEAASLPIVFCTSYSGLIDKARIAKGETVLVHSAAGGIGQSSIQLCKSVGADVIATVGNPAKREYLSQRYGVTKFADSHSNAAWKRDVMTLTNNQGVDAVINSLKGEAITYGLDCLRVGGRFVEIGKVDILANNPLPMGALLKDISFLSTHLDIVMGANSARVSKWMNAISELAANKQITPIVDKVYSARDIEPAFRYLMTGQHMGKVMVDFSATHLPTSVLPASSVFHANATYMLSGGTGAVGLRVVQWMAEQGARYFILLSRRGEASVRASELAELRALERFGVHVLIAKADVGSAEDVKAAVALARSQGHPQKVGILHMAMVLEDDVIPKQTPARFERSIQPKIAGIRNMVNAFQKSEIDFVISFSSVSSVLGNPAQSNYAAGNGFLDSYSFWLRAQGIKAKTVNLGSIEDVGVLAEDYKLRMILNMKGFAGGLTSHGVCLIIDAMLRDDRYTQFVHGAIDFASCCADYPIMNSRFQHLIDWTAVHSAGGASSENTVTLEVLSATIGALLEIPADKVDNKESITRLGLDSLLAVELSSTLKKKFGIIISQMELLGGMSIEDVFNHAQAQA